MIYVFLSNISCNAAICYSVPDFEGSRYEGGSGFNEFELVLDTEVIPKTSKKKVNEELELEKYKKLVAAGKAGSLGITKNVV